jgi:subtilase family serine protease
VGKSVTGAVAVRVSTLGAVLVAIAALALPASADAGTRGAGTSTFTPLPASVSRTTDAAAGAFRSPAVSIEVVLAPSHAAQLHTLLAGLYSPTSRTYRHWLTKGRFAARFAPSGAERSGIVRYLAARGLVARPSASPFLVRASGSTAVISTAFRTSLRMYRDARGISYFANASPVKLPARLARGVLGVVGLTNTIRLRSHAVRTENHVQVGAGRPSGMGTCETPYVTIPQLLSGSFPYGYGAGPGCSGLTPSQDNSIYSAPNAGPRSQGAGANVAVFELSAYQNSDIGTWAHQFYGKHYAPPLENINVDGGPLNPVCPAGDTCPPLFNGYAGDIEVDADIEMSLAIARYASHVLVYNAPNDFTGQTELDEYAAMARQDTADTVSSSWGVCENDVSAAYSQAENVIFEQMAAQGQSVFTSAGDTGAFGCIRSDGTTVVNIGDPGGQPWITDVGGTSLENFNPGQDQHPSYPPPGTETVWNVHGLCNQSADEFGMSGFDWCANAGAGGGGTSEFWGRPAYQTGPGVNSSYTTHGNGTTHCSLARTGTPCREVPDISVNADEYTPYSEYCTGSAATPNSVCASISTTPSGWFGIGGTSLSSPFMAAIIADRDSFTGHRTGNANELLYSLFNNRDSSRSFHDITGIRQVPNNNGLFPVTPGYDMATGVGTPIMGPIITGGQGG